MIVCETPSNSYWKKRNKRTVRNDRNHQKRIETMQTKKSPNDNVNDSNAERNALLDLDLTCWIILSAKFSVKYIYESKNDWRSSCVLLDSSASALQKAAWSCQLADAKRSSCTCIIFGLYVLYLGSYTFPYILSFSCEDRIGSQLAFFFFNYLILVNL